MIFFRKKGEYIKFTEVISILEEERRKHHYAGQASLEKQYAVEQAIKSLKIYHVKQNPTRYMKWQKVFNDEAQYLLTFEELEELKGGAE